MIVRLQGLMFASVLALGSLAASISMGQAETQPGGLRQVQPGGQAQGQLRGQAQAAGQQQGQQAAPQGAMTDAQLVACLLIDNQNEIAAARIAEQRAQDNDVKQFAKKMIEDHTNFINKLRPLAGQYANIGSERNQPRSGRNNLTGAGAGIDFVQLKEQLGQQCRESTSRELESKQGEKFDHCYMGMQVGMHMMMLDTLEVFQQHASPQLKTVLSDGKKTTEEHLSQAKKMIEKMEGGREGSQASRSDRSSRTQ